MSELEQSNIYEHNPDLLPTTDVIPHRPPRLWLSGVQTLVPGEYVKGFWIPGDEQFEGHFPGEPILQGVQEVESLAQLGCYAAMYEKPGELGVLFEGGEDFSFPSPVFPGDVLELRVDFTEQNKRMFRGIGRAAVNGKVTCETKIYGKIAPKQVVNELLRRAKEQRQTES